MSRQRNTRGLTLIELVVAMSVFALVAVMGLQGLSGMLRQRDRAATFAEDSAALGRAAGLIRHDLSAMLPVLFYPPEGRAQSALRELASAGGFAVSVANTRPYPPLGESGLARRVEYRFDPEAGRLLRRAWSTAWPADATAQGPEQVVLEGVTDLRLRSYWTGIGWIDGLRFAALDEARRNAQAAGQDEAAAGPEVYSDQLPQAVEITLVSRAFGEIVLLESPQ
ncbi:type II secretion system protein GspJ [Marimonas arenosa]|uniref:Type II secretion system protein J n=1 Tax=Marimonas arenosa TaxID=1795305 RepID=A0AAE4B842_9RHOB|nr:type II secretion system protein GspJ [Marimonas arenosa]MDQ2092211.1 prepilin-type N-terminal cleavage/methylation domain-containing protein [Marimonas arenosa]